ncbi:MAG: hypothetical protein ACFFB2_12285 [Promethearchaeota archaeon]
MIIIRNKVLRFSLSIFWFLTTLILVVPLLQTDCIDYYPSDDEFEILGFNVQIYFDPKPEPEPKTISSGIDKIKGIINITGEFSGYFFGIIIDSYGTIYNNETIFSNENIGKLTIQLNSSHKAYTEEILIETPNSNGQFTVYMVAYFVWWEEMTYDFSGDKVVKLDAEYQKLGFDLANIIIPSAIFLFCISMIFISVFAYRKIHKQKDIDTNEINKRLEQIIIFNKQFFTRSGGFKDLDLNSMISWDKPGQLNLLEQRKQELEQKLKKLEPRQKELNGIAKRLEEARNPVLNNDLFKVISSHFIHASRKRENYPSINHVEEKVRELRNSLREGRWDELQDLEKVKLAWIICESYIRETNTEEVLLGKNRDPEKEAIALTMYVKNFIQTETNTRWPPDRNLILKTIEESKTDLDIISNLIIKLRKSNKKSIRKYLKKCETIKQEAEDNLKWLKSREADIDTDIASRNLIRLNKLINLLDNELNLLS